MVRKIIRANSAAYPVSKKAPGALVLIDMEPLLRTERTLCHRTENRVQKAKKQLNFHLDFSEPAFAVWYRENFQEKTQMLSSLQARLIDLERIHAEVWDEVVTLGCSEREAYKRIEKKRAGREKIAELLRREPPFDYLSEALPEEIEEFISLCFEYRYGLDREQRWSEGFPEDRSPIDKIAFQKFRLAVLRDIFGSHDRTETEEDQQDGGSRSDQSRRKRDQHGEKSRSGSEAEQEDFFEKTQKSFSSFERTFSEKEDWEESRRKQLYRKLARKLHPDVNGGLSEADKLLWNEVQLAYDDKNLARLESLLSQFESGEPGFYSNLTSVSRLRLLRKDLERKLREIQSRLRGFKKEPSWDFPNVIHDDNRLRRLRSRLDWELSNVLKKIRQEIQPLQDTITQWSLPLRKETRLPRSSRQKRRGPRRRRRWQSDSKWGEK